MIQAIIFDLDGVLIDTADLHYEAFQKAVSLFGYSLDPEVHFRDFNGLPTQAKLERMTETLGLPKGLQSFIHRMKQKYTRTLLSERISYDPHKTELLSSLKKRGIKLALASNCIRSTVDQVLLQLRIREYFDVILSSEDVSRPKPDPEIYKSCIQKLGLRPNECLIIEDSKPGIEAARRTTQNVLVVSHPNDLTEPLIRAKILEISRGKLKTQEPVEILVPMAGMGSRFVAEGYRQPKPFIDVLGKPMIEWVIDNVRPKSYPYHFTFVVNQEHLKLFNLEDRLKNLEPNCSIVIAPGTTEGAACTLMLARDYIPGNRQLLIANSDQWVEAEIDEFLEHAEELDTDGLILTFPDRDPKWSFAKTDKQGLVREVAEKKPISDQATVGIYYFKTAASFFEGTESMIEKDIRTRGEFYVCPVYNELVGSGKKIHLFPIPKAHMHGLGTPEDLQAFLKWQAEEEPAPPLLEATA